MDSAQVFDIFNMSCLKLMHIEQNQVMFCGIAVRESREAAITYHLYPYDILLYQNISICPPVQCSNRTFLISSLNSFRLSEISCNTCIAFITYWSSQIWINAFWENVYFFANLFLGSGFFHGVTVGAKVVQGGPWARLPGKFWKTWSKLMHWETL